MLRLDASLAKSWKLKLPDEYWEALSSLSEETGMPMAEHVRRAVKAYLETQGKPVTSKVQWGGKRRPKAPPVESGDL